MVVLCLLIGVLGWFKVCGLYDFPGVGASEVCGFDDLRSIACDFLCLPSGFSLVGGK